jgi:hypothetical protein
VNGIFARKGTLSVAASWIHDMRPVLLDDVGDGIKVSGAAAGVVGCRIGGGIKRAGMHVSQELGPVPSLVVESTLFESASEYGLRVYDLDNDAVIPGARIASNVFVKGNQDHPIVVSARTMDAGANVAANAWYDGSQPPPVVERGP